MALSLLIVIFRIAATLAITHGVMQKPVTQMLSNETSTRTPLNVDLVVQTIQEREDLLLAYRLAFRDVIFFEFVPREEIGTDFQMRTLDGQKFAKCDDNHRTRYHFWCLAPMLKMLAVEAPSTDGILYLHMDMWIHPRHLVGPQDPNKIWRLGRGLLSRGRQVLNTECLETMEQWTEWVWWEDSLIAGFDAVGTASAKLVPKTTHQTRVCNGWSDMYYLPRTVWADFSRLVPWFGEVFHEVALPTMFDFLVRQLGHQETVLKCWGCCDCGPAPVSALFDNVCGHKMDLRDTKIQAALQQLIFSHD